MTFRYQSVGVIPGGWYMRLLAWLHRRCVHPSCMVVADVCEGDFCRPVPWCRLCGGLRHRDGSWVLAVNPWLPGRSSGESLGEGG